VASFVRRVQVVRSEFTIADNNAPTVVEICRHLDGVAARGRVGGRTAEGVVAAALLRRLERRLPLLTGGARDLPERQQTLRATIAWTYDLLASAEQILFRQLAVFVAGLSQEAVGAVYGGADVSAIDLLDALESLVVNHLLRWDEAAMGLT
jgi:predicted ATPase